MESIHPSTYEINYGRASLEIDKKCGQAISGTYAACEQMIQMSFMVMNLSTLDRILARFERNGRLTRDEHYNLLELAKHLWDHNS